VTTFSNQDTCGAETNGSDFEHDEITEAGSNQSRLEQRCRDLESELSKLKSRFSETMERLRAFGDASPFVFLLCDRDLNIKDINSVALRGLGFDDAESVIGKNMSELFPKLRESGREDTYKRVLESGQQVEFGEVYPCVGSEDRCYSVTVFPVGSDIGIIGVDVTSKILAEKALKDSEERHRLLFESSGLGIAYWTTDGRLITINGVAASHLGKTVDELVGKKCTELFDDKRGESCFERMREVSRVRETRSWTDCIEINGEKKWFLTSYSPVINSDGNVSGVQVIVDDITSIKAAEVELGKSERLHRDMFERNRAIKILIDPNSGYIVDANPAACEFYQYDLDTIKTKHIWDINTLGETDVRKLLHEASNVNNIEYQFQHRLASGEIRDVQVHTGPVESDDRKLVHSIIIDVTERNRALEDLKIERDRTRQYMDVASVMFIGLDRTGTVTLANPKTCEVLGYSEDEIIGRNWFDYFLPGRSTEYVKSVHEKIMAGDLKVTEHVENPVRTKDGSERLILWHNALLRDGEGTPTGTFSSGEDVTENRRTQLELQTIFDVSLDIITIADSETGVFKRVNPAFTKTLGYTEDELLGKSFIEFLHPEDRHSTLAAMDEDKERGKKPRTLENRFRTKSGDYRWLEWSNLEDLGNGTSFAVARDITERKAAEKRLKMSERKFRSYVDNAPDGIFVANREGRYIDANQMACELTGYPRDELLTMSLIDLIQEGSVNAARKHFKTVVENGFADGEIEIRKKDGSDRYWRVKAVTLDSGKFLAFVQDITETKRLRDLESRAERLELAGTIAGQVAHDFNNLLAPIMAYPEFIQEQLSEDHPAQTLLQDIENAAGKIADINQDLLTMGRRGHYTQNILNLNEIVRQVVKEAEVQFSTVSINMELGGDLLSIVGGEAQIYRMLNNLIYNALDAMLGVGEISIKTENFHSDKPIASFYAHIPRGEYVVLTITDTGCGIADEEIKNIFDPFYSTKKSDKRRGSGLGLSIVDAVMKDHHGFIDVSSRINEGTTFYLYFPATKEQSGDRPEGHLDGGNESVLIVDDDQVQRDVSFRLLRRLGYSVSVVGSGEDAIEFVKDNPQDLLLLDMIMSSGMDGAETYRKILETYPDQRAIIISGYSETERVIEAQRLGAGQFVRKPLTMQTIALAVRSELDREGSLIQREI